MIEVTVNIFEVVDVGKMFSVKSYNFIKLGNISKAACSVKKGVPSAKIAVPLI